MAGRRVHLDATTIIVALISAAAGTFGVIASRRGQAKSEQLADQRTEVDRMAKTYDTQQSLIEDLRSERDRIYGLHVEERQRAADALAAAHAHVVTLTRALTELGAVMDASVARSAALVSEEDPNSPEAVQRVRDFIEHMRQIGDGP